jgi:glycosyltransferase involved in cell wall biosynthesis
VGATGAPGDIQVTASEKLPPVLFLADHFGYPGGVAHGASTYFTEVLPALVNAGVDLTVCFLREPHPAAETIRQQGVSPTFLSAWKFNPAVGLKVVEIARQHGCRILHASGFKASLVARVVARIIGARTIVHLHDPLLPSRFVSALHRVAARPSDLGVCVSRGVQEAAIKGYHLRPDRLRVVHNGIRLERIRGVAAGTRSRVREALGIPAASRVIAMIGRMYPIKGHRSMLQMMERIAKACSAALLLVVGDGPERPACEAIVEQHALQEHVRFLGQRTDVPELLAASDLVVMPSRAEGLGLAAIEALAAGRPVVAFDVGGLGEVVTDGADGRLIRAGDEDAFVESVVTLLMDQQLLKACGERAALAAERFSLERHIEKLLGCYREVAAGDPAKPTAYA